MLSCEQEWNDGLNLAIHRVLYMPCSDGREQMRNEVELARRDPIRRSSRLVSRNPDSGRVRRGQG